MNEVGAYTRLAGVYDEIVVDPCYSLWADFLDAMWRLDAQGVRTVLDVCCGTGLMAAELIKRGYSVVGADASAAMLARARSLLGDDVQLIEAILPELGTTAMFDAATSNFVCALPWRTSYTPATRSWMVRTAIPFQSRRALSSRKGRPASNTWTDTSSSGRAGSMTRSAIRR